MELAMIYQRSMFNRSMFSYLIMIHVVWQVGSYWGTLWFFFLIAQARPAFGDKTEASSHPFRISQIATFTN